MDNVKMTVFLSSDRAELLLTEGLCNSFGASLTDRRDFELNGTRNRVLIFSRFYVRAASLLGLTVVLKECNSYCEVSFAASCGEKGFPIVKDFGAEVSFCERARGILKPFEVR